MDFIENLYFLIKVEQIKSIDFTCSTYIDALILLRVEESLIHFIYPLNKVKLTISPYGLLVESVRLLCVSCLPTYPFRFSLIVRYAFYCPFMREMVEKKGFRRQQWH